MSHERMFYNQRVTNECSTINESRTNVLQARTAVQHARGYVPMSHELTLLYNHMSHELVLYHHMSQELLYNTREDV